MQLNVVDVAGAVRANQGMDGAARDGQAEIVHSDKPAEADE